MKTSNKLVLLLAILIVGGLFVSNYQLKKQFDSIDPSDPYWEFQVLELPNFHHVKIKGGNLMQTVIVRGDKSNVMRNGNLKDWLNAAVKNDTLFVDFTDHVKTTRQRVSDTMIDEKIIISITDLQSLTASKANVEIRNSSAPNLKILAKNHSSVDLKGSKSTSEMTVQLFDTSFFGIYNQNDETVNFNKLMIAAADSSNVILKNVNAQSGSIVLKDKATITAGAQVLQLINK